ncbi:MAG: hypothetical protein LBT25_06270 [Candidatus Symbiothrix sp.]|jgi:hypothetical protein|nr:hypothetical protein [Candidatus Symbiothrix sp.]
MAIYAVKTDRMDITLNLSSGYIFVQQKWRYNWIDESGTNPWTLQEKRDFHNRADKWIWDLWSSKAYAVLIGNSRLAQEHKNTKLKINVDIKWVTGREQEHWNVNVTKIDRNSYIRWNNRTIKLHINDVAIVGVDGRADPDMRYAHIPVTHEFGHSLGNSRYALSSSDSIAMHGDEYKDPGLSMYRDDASIMSVGTAIRPRHFDFLKIQLTRLVNNDVEIYLF